MSTPAERQLRVPTEVEVTWVTTVVTTYKATLPFEQLSMETKLDYFMGQELGTEDVSILPDLEERERIIEEAVTERILSEIDEVKVW